MDSLTQIVLGASVGEAVLGKKVGNKAPLWGAVAGTIPDLDVLTRYILSPVDSLLAHRGFSHSIVFCILAAPLFGYLVYRIHKNDSATWKDWSWLFFWGLFTHPLLDSFTTWGTQLFWPMVPRLAYKSIFVIDPLYTFPFLLFLILAVIKRKDVPIRRKFNNIGLTISTIYLLATFVNKLDITQIFENSLKGQEIAYSRIETKPMPLQNILWTANVEVDSGYYIGYYSRFDESDEIHFNFYPHNKHRIKTPLSEEFQKLYRMTNGWYALDQVKDTLVIHDLRFGIMGDFETGEGEFVFDYLAKPFEENGRTVYHIEQKRNSFNGSDTLVSRLLRRIGGV